MADRLLIPGLWGRTGHAIRLQGYAHCTGGCHGGRRGCDCATRCVEMACDLPPDASRVIAPPEQRAADQRVADRLTRIQAHAVALFWTVVGLAGSAAVLSLLQGAQL